VLNAPVAVDPDMIRSVAHAEAQRERESVARDLMTDLVEDWETICGPPNSQTAYRQWLAKQPQAYQQEVASSWRPGVLANSIKKFQQEQHPTPRAVSGGTRQARLAAAVAPKGKPAALSPATKTPEEEMLEGFNS
jgi:hypothetical protein